MKLLYQFGVILTITFLGEVLHMVLPFPVPASIYGLVLMLLALCTKIVKLENVKVAGDFLLEKHAFFESMAAPNVLQAFCIVIYYLGDR